MLPMGWAESLPLLIVAGSIVVLVALVVWAKVHPLLAFVLVSAAAAFGLGMPAAEVAGAIRKGMGDILGALTIVIVAGAMLGKLVAESGAAQRIASALVASCGPARMAWAMAATGLVVGIPLFFGVGFVLLVPIIFAVISGAGLPLVVVGLPALAAMSVAHGLLPPHPAPTGLVATFEANMGLTLLYGLIVSVPAIVVGGPLFSRFLTGIKARPLPGLIAEPKPEDELPGLAVSVVTALLPAVLLVVSAGASLFVPDDSPLAGLVAFAADPDVVMIVSLLFAAYTLGIARGKPLAAVMHTYSAAIVDVASILLVIAGSGAFKQVIVATGVDGRIATVLEALPLDPLILGWLVAAAIRVCVGSATIAGLTAASIIAPLVVSSGGEPSLVEPNLMVLAIGAGSIFCSHVNDGAFWMFKEYFNVSIGDTLKSWTLMESIVSIVALAGVLLLDLVV
jgi:Gnt-I system high-affinity gluconate transporter